MSARIRKWLGQPLERSLAAESLLVAQRLGECLLDDIARTLHAAGYRREHDLECTVTAPIQVFQVGVHAAHVH